MTATVVPGRNKVPPPGTPLGDLLRDRFEAAVLGITGDTRIFYLPRLGETTTSTERSLNARLFTYDATVASRIADLGSGVSVDFDGTDDEADTPDQTNLSFGNGISDNPLSVLVLCKPDVNDAAMSLIDKENSSSAEEWTLVMTTDGYVRLTLTDESATAVIEGTYETAVGTDWTLLGATYDGSAQATGIKVYKDGAAVTTAAATTGTYTAMEDTASLVHLGARYATKGQFFNGRIATALVVAGALTPSAMWAIKKEVNSFFGLSL